MHLHSLHPWLCPHGTSPDILVDFRVPLCDGERVRKEELVVN